MSKNTFSGPRRPFVALTVAALLVLALGSVAFGQHATHSARTSVFAGGELQLTKRVEPGWKRRARQGVLVVDSRDEFEVLPDGALRPRQIRTLGLRPVRQGLLDLRAWPAEPSTPENIDSKRFAQALTTLCPPWIDPALTRQYAEAILRYSDQFGVDPMLLGALVYQQSRCHAGLRNSYGTGLTMINPPMHRRSIRDRQYHYGMLQGETWQRADIELWRYEYSERTLGEADANLYFAAAILRAFREQCNDIDGAFHSVPHRHHVSHFIWGDRVRGRGPEDRILLARRRLVQYYGVPSKDDRMATVGSVSLSLPLDGAPRIVISEFGDEREQGLRSHRGVDFHSEQGEPVRAAAPGIIVEAGAQLRRRGVVNVDPSSARLVPLNRLGPQGLVVRIQHADRVQTLYAHLVAYKVKVGQRVERGQLIGYVGRTGMKESDAHLHFGLFHKDAAINVESILESNVFPFAETWAARPKQHVLPAPQFRTRRRRQSVLRAGRVRSLNQVR